MNQTGQETNKSWPVGGVNPVSHQDNILTYLPNKTQAC